MPYSAPGTPTTGPKVLGFIGLGNMGFPIAKNIALHHAQHHPGLLTLVVWNRSIEKAHKFVEEVEEQQAANGGMLHCRVADSVEELASEADFIVTSMGTDVAMLALADQIAAAIKVLLPLPTKKNDFDLIDHSGRQAETQGPCRHKHALPVKRWQDIRNVPADTPNTLRLRARVWSSSSRDGWQAYSLSRWRLHLSEERRPSPHPGNRQKSSESWRQRREGSFLQVGGELLHRRQ